MKKMKTYYFPDTEYIDGVFCRELPICIDAAEMERLAHEWETEETSVSDIIQEQFHEATPEEIAEYGVYDS